MKVLILLFCATLAFAFEEDYDDGSGGKKTETCAEEYNSCRNSKVHDLKNIYTCGKQYVNCRAAPAVACVKKCHVDFLQCRVDKSIFDRGQCYLDLAKGYRKCKIAPHHDDEQMDFVEDLEDDGTTCAADYTTCRDAAVIHDIKNIYKCGQAYLKCRIKPAADCVKQCHATLSQCRKDSSGITGRLQCYLDLTKCYTTCKIASHNDELDVELDEELEDGSGAEVTCLQKYRTCRASAKRLGEKFTCGRKFFHCKGRPVTICVKQCHNVAIECVKKASGLGAHLVCVKAAGKCYLTCRPGTY